MASISTYLHIFDTADFRFDSMFNWNDFYEPDPVLNFGYIPASPPIYTVPKKPQIFNSRFTGLRFKLGGHKT